MVKVHVRFDKKHDEILDYYVKNGYYKTKADVIRAGLLVLYKKYLCNPKTGYTYDVKKPAVISSPKTKIKYIVKKTVVKKKGKDKKWVKW